METEAAAGMCRAHVLPLELEGATLVTEEEKAVPAFIPPYSRWRPNCTVTALFIVIE